MLGALAAQPASGKDLAEIRSLVDEFENTRKKIITLLNQPWTERLSWTLLHFLVAGDSGGSPLGASPRFGRHFGARPLRNCLRFAVGDDRGACAHLLVA